MRNPVTPRSRHPLAYILKPFLLLILAAFVEGQPATKLQALQDVWLFSRIQAVAKSGQATDVTKEVVEKLVAVAGPPIQLSPGFTFRPLTGLDPAIVRPDGTKRESVQVTAGILETTLDLSRLEIPNDGLRMTLIVIVSAERGAAHVSPGDNLYLRLFNLTPLRNTESALIDFAFGQSVPHGAGGREAENAVDLLSQRIRAGRFQFWVPPKDAKGDLAVMSNRTMKRLRDGRLPESAPTVFRKSASGAASSGGTTAAASFVDAQFFLPQDEGGGILPPKISDLIANELGTAIACSLAGYIAIKGAAKAPILAAPFVACVAWMLFSTSGSTPLDSLWDRNVPPQEACIVRPQGSQSVAMFVNVGYEPPSSFERRTNSQKENGLTFGNPGCGRSSGDPHMSTHDGLKYDFQGVGEFVLSKTEGFEVQGRMVAWGGSRTVSVNGAVAAKFGSDRVALYPGDPIRFTINGVETEPLKSGEAIYMPGGLQVEKYKDWYRFARNGYLVEANPGKDRVGTIFVRVPEGSAVAGLLGNRDGDRENDLALPGGELLKAPVGFDDLYRRFGNAWRVETRNSLFDYTEGESTVTFTDLKFPSRRTSVADVGADARRAAEAICRRAGITASDLEDCVYDIAVTGDETFADDAKGGRADAQRLEMRDKPPIVRETADGVKIEVPAEAIASFPVEIRVSGPAPAHTLTFTAAVNPPSSRPPNAYSSIRLKGGEQVVILHAPYRPGDYELRYVTFPGNRNILLSIPFRAVAPNISIEAAEVGAARGTFDLYVHGDLSSNMKVTVVPVGSRDNFVGPHAFVKGGLGERVTIRSLPSQTGKYEIRVVSSTSETIYARKELEIKLK